MGSAIAYHDINQYQIDFYINGRAGFKLQNFPFGPRFITVKKALNKVVLVWICDKDSSSLTSLTQNRPSPPHY